MSRDPSRERGGSRARPALARALPWIAPFALLVLFAVLYATSRPPHGMFLWDEAEYASLGRSLARGEGYTINHQPSALRPPLLPLAVAASLTVARTGRDGAAQAPVILFAVMGLALVFGMARPSLGDRGAAAAAVLLGTMPLYWTNAVLLLTEIPFLCAFTLAVGHLHRALSGEPRSWWWTWLGVALALLTRYTALLFAPVAVLVVLIVLATRGRATVLRALRAREAWLAPVAAFAVLAPWLVRQGVVFGDPLVGFREAARLIPNWVSLPWHQYLSTLPSFLSWPTFALAALGFLVAVRTRDPLGLTCVATAALVIAWHSRLPYKEPRFVSAALPFLAVLAAIGLERLVAPLLARVLHPRGAAVGVAIALVGIAAADAALDVRLARRNLPLGFPSFLDAMRELRRVTPDSARVLGSSLSQITWYADRVTRDFPPRREELTAALAASSWTVIVSFERGQPAYAVELARLLGPEDAVRGDARLFRDERSQTVLVRSSLLAQRIGAP